MDQSPLSLQMVDIIMQITSAPNHSAVKIIYIYEKKLHNTGDEKISQMQIV
jgi:hypothetical protein